MRFLFWFAVAAMLMNAFTVYADVEKRDVLFSITHLLGVAVCANVALSERRSKKKTEDIEDNFWKLQMKMRNWK